jgi:hypothetical protein
LEVLQTVKVELLVILAPVPAILAEWEAAVSAASEAEASEAAVLPADGRPLILYIISELQSIRCAGVFFCSIVTLSNCSIVLLFCNNSGFFIFISEFALFQEILFIPIHP